jgi:cyclopropane fatty-acyl-phospholipid synthase-like methyltransferase
VPVSDPDGKPWALSRYLDLQPATVVDIGPGEGTYARLMRPHHRARWGAVEAWGPYVEQFDLNRLYDHVIVADARYLDPVLYAVDLVIAGDVLEHMTHDDARQLLRRITAYARHLLVSIPVRHLAQGAYQGNWFETHVEHWHFAEMHDALTKLPDGQVLDSYEGHTLAYYLWQRVR